MNRVLPPGWNCTAVRRLPAKPVDI
jgi:hypothetical protein